MKYGITVGSNHIVWLDQDKLNALADILHGALQTKDEYVGSGKGDDGGNYSKLIRPFDMEENLPVKVMLPDRFDALVLKTKLHDEVKK